MEIAELVHRCARVAPERAALIDEHATTSFETLSRAIDHFATALTAKAPQTTRIGVCAANSTAMATALYAIPQAGRIAVFANIAQHPREIAATFVRAGVEHLVGTSNHLTRVKDALVDVGYPVRTTTFEELATTPSGTTTRPALGRNEAWLLHTSGTTGAPKGVLLSHENLLAAAENARVARGFGDDEVLLLPFPLFHIASTNLLVAHAAGRPVVLPAAFDPVMVLDLISRHGVTALSLAPTMLVRLLDHPHRREVDLSSLRTVFYGAAPIAPVLLERASAAFHCAFSQGYGMTEVGGNAIFLNAADHQRGLDGDPSILKAAGRPGPHISLSLIDEHGTVVPRGTVGEIALRGPQVFAGYDGDEEATKAAFTNDGSFRTGDLGVIDEGGLLSVVDRKKDLIISGGENVSSLEVEAVLVAQDGISAAAVVGVSDPEWGEAVTAVLIVDQDFDEANLRAHLRSVMAGYKRPKHYVYLDTLPLTSTGKVDKVSLRSVAATVLAVDRSQ